MSRQLKLCFETIDYEISDAKSKAILIEDLGYLSSLRQVNKKDREYILSYYLVLYFIHWERFLEAVFIRYMCGYKGIKGNQLIPTGNRFTKLTDAYSALLGKSPYLNWSTKNTIQRADSIFGSGNIISANLLTYNRDIEAINIIRNAAAHRSPSTDAAFQQLVIRELGSLPRGITPGTFLLKIKSGTRQQYIDYYAQVLLTLAKIISDN